MSSAPGFLLAFIAGIACSIQGQFTGTLTRSSNLVGNVVVTYGIGALTALVLWGVTRGPLPSPRDVPWYVWTAGMLGIVIVGGIGAAADTLGLSRTMVVAVAAQLVAAVVIDHFGWFGATQRSFELTRGIGIVAMMAGVWLVVKE